MIRTIGAGALLLAVASGVASCGNEDQDQPLTNATFPPIGVPARTAGPAAVRAYVAETGMEGNRGRLTEPSDCAQLGDGHANGDFCIVEDGTVYATTFVIMFVADVDNQEEEIWSVRAVQGSVKWEIGEVERVPSE